MKKIAVLSDIHGNLIALEKVVQDIERREVDLVINLGDHVSGPLWPKETLDYLKVQDWVHIGGNHERQLSTQALEEMNPSDRYAKQYLDADDLKWIMSLPARTEIGSDIVLFHGSPSNDNQYLLETIADGHAHLATHDEILRRIGNETAPIILCGHSHIPRVMTLSNNILLVNPGSVGLQAYDDTKPEPHVMEAGSPHARYAILEHQADVWTVELIAVSYDHHQASERARNNGRADWAFALQTGFMNMK